MRETRYYQTEAHDAVFSALKRNIKHQLLVMATGTGKTKTAVDIVKKFNSVLWITHNIELIEQSSIALLSEYLSMEVPFLEENISARGGIVSVLTSKVPADDFTQTIRDSIGLIKEDTLITDKKFTIASIQTLWRRLNLIPPDTFDVVVVDEAHHAGAATWTRTLNHFTPKLRLGLTATPWRAVDDLSLDDLFEEIVYEYPIEKGIKDGYLSKPFAIKVATSANLDNVHMAGSDFNQKELSDKVNTPERNNLIVTKYLEYGAGRPFIAFCCNVEHTIDLCRHFTERGVKANFLVGDKNLSPDRIGVIKSFKSQNFINGEAEGLINCMIATEGFDFANTACVIQASPTKSKTKFYQMIGRGLRNKSEAFVEKFGQNCLVLDIVDNTTKHRVITCASEDDQRDLEDKIFISDVDRQKIRDVVAARERMVRIADRKEDERVELFKIPRVKVLFGNRSDDPLNPGQKQWLKMNNYDTVNISYNRHQFLTLFFASPAPESDIQILRDNGYSISDPVTIGEAVEAKKQIAARAAKANTIRLQKEGKL
ncbi:MAG: DEAD/DEAH box helicase [Bacteroidota bacterium]